MVNATIDSGGVLADTGRGVFPLPRERVITNSQGATLEWIVGGGGSPNPRLTTGGNWEEMGILYILDFLFDGSLCAASVLFVYTL